MMKKPLLLSALYIGTFSMAFAGFFFIKMDAMNTASDPIARQQGESVTAILSADQTPSSRHTDTVVLAHGATQDIPRYGNHQTDPQLAYNRTDKNHIGEKQADRIFHKQITAEQTVNASAQTMSHTAEYNYTETGSSGSDVSNAVADSYGYSRFSSNNIADVRTAYSETADASSNTITSADTFTGTTVGTETQTDTSELIVSDGSEFLPDGSSQDDLANSLAKNPRVYTIEDYQQASIVCDQGYGTPSAHADLMLQLKGC